jgi:hypothetical protein
MITKAQARALLAIYDRGGVLPLAGTSTLPGQGNRTILKQLVRGGQLVVATVDGEPAVRATALARAALDEYAKSVDNVG